MPRGREIDAHVLLYNDVRCSALECSDRRVLCVCRQLMDKAYASFFRRRLFPAMFLLPTRGRGGIERALQMRAEGDCSWPRCRLDEVRIARPNKLARYGSLGHALKLNTVAPRFSGRRNDKLFMDTFNTINF